MDRRDLLKRLGMGLMGVYVGLKIPISIAPNPIQPKIVSAYLTKRFNESVKMKLWPTKIWCSRELFEVYENGLQVFDRWTDATITEKSERWLAFKSVKLMVDSKLTGWNLIISGEESL